MQALTAEQYDRLARLAQAWQREHLVAAKVEPHFNPRLGVDALCFQPWTTDQGHHGLLGALITPVSLSLVWMPNDAERPAQAPGDRLVLALPSGRYPFHAERLGDDMRLWRCPLLDDLSDLESLAHGSRLAQRLMEQVMEGED
ncbi:[NiFe]-hydrogenase assembly chaperone HybE [Halomonas sp. THAF12]|uniref:[NiFe]-hydrogenase assembly chaperone HybE n=1 Tax=Halomonas sp. B23F22_10 TaxID=3459515 RepID=UPI00373F31F8